jgi:V-type H+-transporting ATPase subunit a
MFGDYGHGSIILAAAACLFVYKDRILQTALSEAVPLRYLLLMMGILAMYTGLLYNEFFAIPNNWFGSCFEISTRSCTEESLNCNPSYWPLGCS